jgi:hypothetical protein
MPANPQPPNPLASHWQAGGWYGSQLGGTAWLFVSALVIGAESPSSAAVLLACGLAANLVGAMLWAQRARLDPYRALQVLVAAIVVAGAAATRWLELRGEFELLDPRVGPRTMYVLLAVLWLGLAAVFTFKGRAARKAAAA